jgi:type II secretory pathway pseudopilin PulG
MKTLTILIPMKLQRQAKSRCNREQGYAMAALLVAMSIMAVMLAVAMPVWKQMTQREKEEELIFRGQQYVHAIGLFQRKYAGAFPPTVDVLVNERFLRKKFKDPITNDDFVPMMQGAGGAPGTGTATSSTPGQIATNRPSNQTVAGQPPRSPGSVAPRGAPSAPTAGISAPTAGITPGTPTAGIMGVTSKSTDKSIRLYNGRGRYNEWAFVYTAQMQAPGAATPGAVPGAVPGTAPGAGRGSLPDSRRGGGRSGTGGGRGTPPPGGGRGFTPGFGTPRGSGR